MNNIPKGYKQTEVGVVPEDWEVRQLCEIGEVIRGASPRPKGDKRYYGGSIPRLMVEDVTRDGKMVFPRVDYLTEEGALKSRPCKKGTITIVCSGTVGVTSFLGIDACIHDGFLALIKIKKNVSDDYLYHQLSSLQEVFNTSATHGGVFTNLTTSGVKEFSIPIPPTLTEQTAIATALSDADALIQSLEKLIAKKRAIKQGAMQELLRPKEGWVVKKLGEILDSFQLGGNYPNSEAESNHPLIKMGNLNRGYIDLKKLEFINNDVLPSQKDRLHFGDVLFNTRNTLDLVGKVAIWKDELSEAYFNSNIMRFNFKQAHVSSTFCINFMLNTKGMISKLRGMATGTTSVAAVYTRDLLKLDIPLPSLDEQICIATILSDMDEEIATLEIKLAKYKKIKQGMMQNLLTGRIRLV